MIDRERAHQVSGQSPVGKVGEFKYRVSRPQRVPSDIRGGHFQFEAPSSVSEYSCAPPAPVTSKALGDSPRWCRLVSRPEHGCQGNVRRR